MTQLWLDGTVQFLIQDFPHWETHHNEVDKGISLVRY